MHAAYARTATAEPETPNAADGGDETTGSKHENDYGHTTAADQYAAGTAEGTDAVCFPKYKCARAYALIKKYIYKLKIKSNQSIN